MKKYRLDILLLSVVCLAVLPGCNLIAGLVAVFVPPPKTPAVYKMPKEKTTLVLVEDSVYQADVASIRPELTARLNDELVRNEIAASTIEYEKILDLMTTTPNFHQLAVCEIGQKLGADLILYVQIESFQLKDPSGSGLWQGRLEVSTRVVDKQGQKLWPDDRAKYPVPAVELPLEESSSASHGTELVKTLAQQMADKVAKLFYAHREER